MLGASVPAGNFIPVASGPHDVGIGQIRNGEAGFATTHRVIPTGFAGVYGHAGAAHVPIVLHVAVEVVRNLVVNVDVVHLADGQSNAVKTAAVHGRNLHAAVVGDHEAIGIGGIDPDVVSVSAPRDVVKILACIQRLVEGTVRDVDFIVAAGRNGDSNVVARAADQGALVIDRLPVFSGIIGSPERSLIFGLNQGKDTIRIRWSNRDIDLAERRREAGHVLRCESTWFRRRAKRRFRCRGRR